MLAHSKLMVAYLPYFTSGIQNQTKSNKYGRDIYKDVVGLARVRGKEERESNQNAVHMYGIIKELIY